MTWMVPVRSCCPAVTCGIDCGGQNGRLSVAQSKCSESGTRCAGDRAARCWLLSLETERSSSVFMAKFLVNIPATRDKGEACSSRTLIPELSILRVSYMASYSACFPLHFKAHTMSHRLPTLTIPLKSLQNSRNTPLCRHHHPHLHPFRIIHTHRAPHPLLFLQQNPQPQNRPESQTIQIPRSAPAPLAPIDRFRRTRTRAQGGDCRVGR